LTPADPVTPPIAHGEPLGRADQHVTNVGRVTGHGTVRSQPVAVRGVADALTARASLKRAGRPGRSPTG
jgi:hypothetical protein